jgi:outer membrane protein TolC
VSFGADSDYWTASLVLSWNVFNGGQTGARRHAAIAERDRIRVHRDDTENLIRLEARQAYHSAVVARDAIRTAEDQLAAAERSFTLVRRRYEEGLASTVEFLDARTALTSAELNRVITVYRYAMRWVELERAAALRNDTAMGGES